MKCDEVYLSFAGLCCTGIALFIAHALEWDSVKTLRNRENVRDVTFARECSQRERSRINVCEGRRGYNVRVDGKLKSHLEWL